jgi:hypothetical protein
MARNRIKGRFVQSNTDEPEETHEQAPKTRKGLRGLKHCQSFSRREFSEALPEIVAAMLERARTGSVSHLAILLQLTGLDKEVIPPKGPKKRKGLEQILMEQWARDKAEAKAEAEANPPPPPPRLMDPSEWDF